MSFFSIVASAMVLIPNMNAYITLHSLSSKSNSKISYKLIFITQLNNYDYLLD